MNIICTCAHISLSLSLSLYIYIYMYYMYVHIYIYIYIYIYIPPSEDREAERQHARRQPLVVLLGLGRAARSRLSYDDLYTVIILYCNMIYHTVPRYTNCI